MLLSAPNKHVNLTNPAADRRPMSARSESEVCRLRRVGRAQEGMPVDVISWVLLAVVVAYVSALFYGMRKGMNEIITALSSIDGAWRISRTP